jgi:maltose O-acetyltransferase
MSKFDDALAFDSLAPERVKQRQLAQAICREFARDPSRGNLKKLRQMLARCGEQVFIEYGFHCDYGNYIELGDRVYINCKCTFLDGGKIIIGNDCLIGPNVQLITVFHHKDPAKRLSKTNYVQDIVIGNNVWIGAGAILLPGIRVGDNAIIGAAAVVTKDVAENTTVVGNPARLIQTVL